MCECRTYCPVKCWGVCRVKVLTLMAVHSWPGYYSQQNAVWEAWQGSGFCLFVMWPSQFLATQSQLRP